MENLRRRYDQLKRPTPTLLASDFDEFSRHFQGFVRMSATETEPVEYTDLADKFMKSILRNPGLSPEDYIRASALDQHSKVSSEPSELSETDSVRSSKLSTTNPETSEVHSTRSSELSETNIEIKSKRYQTVSNWLRTVLVVLLVLTAAYTVKQLIY